MILRQVMWMPINIEYQQQHNVSDKIVELLNLLLNNMNLLIAISKIDIEIEMCKIKNEPYDKNRIIEDSLEELEYAGFTDDEEAIKFRELWDKAEAENQLGKLLEEIIAKSGSYLSKYDDYDYSRESKVKETKKDSNFDVIFYCRGTSVIHKKENLVEIKEQSEFHECKKNVCNEIPYDEKLLSASFKRKLDFILDVKNLTNECFFYIPTFKYNVTGSEKYLNEHGYKFIEILNIDKIINRYAT